MMKRFTLITLVLSFLYSFSEAQTEEKDVINAFGLFETEQYEKAVKAFDLVIDTYRKYDEKCTYYKGIANFHLQNYTAAKSDLKRANESGFAEANLWLAKTYVALDQYNEAAGCIQNYLKTCEHPDIAGIKKDSLFKKLHYTEAWLSLWENDLLSDEENVHEEVLFLLSKENFKKAHAVIEDNLDKGYDDAFLLELNSKVYQREKILELALNEINKAISIQAENEGLLKCKVKYLIELNKNYEAVEILTKLLEADPGDFALRYERANAAYKAGIFELAESDTRIYLNYFNTPDASFLMGQILYEEKKYLDALKYFNPLLEEDTSQAKYYLARGMCYYQTKTYKFAAYDLSMSLDLEPNDAQANLYLGITSYFLGDKELCCYYLNRAKTFGELTAITYLQNYCDKTKRP